MNKFKTLKCFSISLALLLIIMGVFTAVAVAQQTDPPPTVSLLIKLVSGLTADQQAAVIARDGGVEVSSIPALRLHVVEISSADLSTVLSNYQSDPQVQSVEQNNTRKIEGTPSDPLYPNQWSLPKIGWDYVYGNYVPLGFSTVAVLDTGIDVSHPDLTSVVVPGTSILDGSNGMTDPNGHGTWLAGIVAASTNNSIGIAGVGFANVSLMPVTVLGPDGTGQDSDIISGVIYAVDHGANVILMGFSNPGFSQNLQDAIDYAWSKNVVLVAATGNDGVSTPTYPAGDQGVIGVSATDQYDILASFSNYGADTFLAAPGTDILTTDLNSGYATVSGTSTSAAIVAGVAGFMKANDPTLANGVIVGRLAETTDPAGTTAQTGNGRVDMARAVADTNTNFIEPIGAPGGGPYVAPYTEAAPSVHFVTSPFIVDVSQCSPAIIIQTPGGTSTSVSLVTSSSGGAFYSDSTCTTPITSVITSASHPPRATFYYKDGTVGTPTITLTATGYKPGTQQETVSNTAIGTTTSLTVNPSSVTYNVSTTVTLTATLTRNDTSGPLSGAAIDFIVAGVDLGTVNTDTNGQASKTFDPSNFTNFNPPPANAPMPPGTYDVVAEYSGSTIGTNTYSGSSGSGTLTVNGTAPAITSVNSITFTVGTAGSFTVTTTGSPTPSLSESGTLPSGVTFTDNGDGTGTLAGTPDLGTVNTYSITFTAKNGVTPNATQIFTLTVQKATATVTVNSVAVVYDGTQKSVSVSTTPIGLTVDITYDGSATAPTNVKIVGGIVTSYAVVATIDDTNYQGTGSGTLTITQAAPVITFNAAPTPTYLGPDFTVSASTTNTDNPALTYSVDSGPCTFVSGSTFHATGAGTCVVMASSAATTNFQAASNTQSVTIAQATPVFSNLSASQKIPYGTASITLTGAIAAGTVTPPTSEIVTATINGASSSASIASDGSFSISFDSHAIPAAAAPYTITYSYAGDTNFMSASDSSTTLTVDNPPVSSADYYITEKNTVLNVYEPGVLGNDNDVDTGQTLTAVKVSDPANGTLTLNADGSFTYTPNPGYTGTDSFTYEAFDGIFDSNPVTVAIYVFDPASASPVAVNDSYSVDKNGMLTIGAPGILGNDNDLAGNPLTAVKVSDPANGTLTLNADGSFTYTPNTGYTGTDSFTYKANDGTNDSNIAMVTITVLADSASSIAVNDAYSTDQDTALSMSASGVLINDTIPSGHSVAAELVANPTFGTVTLSGDGAFVYTPNTGFNGMDTFFYRVHDTTSGGDSNVAMVEIRVRAKPVFSNLSAPTITYGDTPTTIGGTIKAGLLIPPGDVAITLNGVTHTATIQSDGTFSYSFATDGLVVSGSQYTISFSYTGDAIFTDASATSKLTVNPAATTTSISAPTITYNANGTVTVTVTSTAGTVTGNVSLSVDGGTAVAKALSSGSATFTATDIAALTSPNAGDHTLSASYAAQGNFDTSSKSGTLHVNPAATTTSINAPTITYNANGTVTVTVSSTAGTPTGNVSLTVDGGTPMSAALNGSGIATFTLTSPNAGDHTLSASYAAQGNFDTSSKSGTLHVNSAATSTTVLSSLNPSIFGTSVTFTALVTNTESAAVPTGTVSFSIDGVVVGGTLHTCPSALPANRLCAVYSTSALAVSGSPHTVSAAYTNTDGNFQSSSGTLNSGQTVNPYPITATVTVSAPTPAVPTVSYQYSDRVVLTVSFPNTQVSAQNPGQSNTQVALSIGTQEVASGLTFDCTTVAGSCTATTTVNLLENPNGNGQMSPVSHTVTANITNLNPDFTLSATPSTTLTIQPEDAAVTYTGQTFWSVSSTQTAVNVPVSFTLQDATATGAGSPIYDLYAGDITKANVVISMTGQYFDPSKNGMSNFTAACTPKLAPTGQVDPTNGLPSTATVSCTFNSVPVNGTYQVTIAPGSGSYYTFPGGYDTLVYIGITNGGGWFITGGGYQTAKYLTSNPAGLTPAVGPHGVLGTMTAKMNFGYTAKYNKSGANVQASVNIIVRTMCDGTISKYVSSYKPKPGDDGLCVYQIKSNKVISMSDVPFLSSGSPGYGVLVVGANIQDVTQPTAVSLMGGGQLQLIMYDNAEPGTGKDTLAIQFTDSSGNLWFSNSWTGTKTAIYNGSQTNSGTVYAPVIQGGNLQVH